MTATRHRSHPLASLVVGTGHYVPQRVRDNGEVARASGTDCAWIVARTGIRERRIASGSENAGTLAYEAARLALEDAGVDAGGST
jgi:3-oxoacyl-[acyl-carrier-protein] synthase-3